MKKNHPYYFQITMQIYVADKQFCDLFVYHQESEDEFSYQEQRINRTAETDAPWNTMKDKLTKFYMEDMAPEIAGPDFPRIKLLQAANLPFGSKIFKRFEVEA
jgi:hypothetical protein